MYAACSRVSRLIRYAAPAGVRPWPSTCEPRYRSVPADPVPSCPGAGRRERALLRAVRPAPFLRPLSKLNKDARDLHQLTGHYRRRLHSQPKSDNRELAAARRPDTRIIVGRTCGQVAVKKCRRGFGPYGSKGEDSPAKGEEPTSTDQCSLRSPVPFPSLTKPTDVFAAGRLRIVPASSLAILDYVPVDYVVEGSLALSRRRDTAGKTLHLTAGEQSCAVRQCLRLIDEGVARHRGTRPALSCRGHDRSYRVACVGACWTTQWRRGCRAVSRSRQCPIPTRRCAFPAGGSA